MYLQLGDPKPLASKGTIQKEICRKKGLTGMESKNKQNAFYIHMNILKNKLNNKKNTLQGSKDVEYEI